MQQAFSLNAIILNEMLKSWTGINKYYWIFLVCFSKISIVIFDMSFWKSQCE